MQSPESVLVLLLVVLSGQLWHAVPTVLYVPAPQALHALGYSERELDEFRKIKVI